MAATSADNGYSSTFAIGDGGDPTETFTAVAEVFSITGPGRSRESIDATHLDSDNGYREFIPGGVIDGGEVTIELNYIPATSDVLITALENTAAGNFRITHPNLIALTFSGFCTAYEVGPITVDEKLTLTATFKITGQPTLSDETP